MQVSHGLGQEKLQFKTKNSHNYKIDRANEMQQMSNNVTFEAKNLVAFNCEKCKLINKMTNKKPKLIKGMLII